MAWADGQQNIGRNVTRLVASLDPSSRGCEVIKRPHRSRKGIGLGWTMGVQVTWTASYRRIIA